MASTHHQELGTVPADRRVVITNEKVTGPPAAEMLRWANIHQASSDALELLDNATGGGILVAELFKLAAKHGETVRINRIVAGDKDDKMLQFASQTKREYLAAGLDGWNKVEVTKIDQQAIPFADAAFTHVLANFGIFFCPDDDKALTEAFRVLKPGGTVGFTSWKSIAWWPEVAEPAMKRFVSGAPDLPSPGQVFSSKGWSDPVAIPAKMEKAGFNDVKVTEYQFTPDVEAEEFAEATSVLTRIVAQRLWPGDISASYVNQLEPAILRYLRENYKDGKWDGKMTAIITLGKKT